MLKAKARLKIQPILNKLPVKRPIKNTKKIVKKISSRLLRNKRIDGRDRRKTYDSPHYSVGRFHNFEEDDKTLALRSFQKFVKWKWFTPLEKPSIPEEDWLIIEEPPSINKLTEDLFVERNQENMRVFWLGHSTLLFTIATKKNQFLNIITDPILGDISYVMKRLAPIPIHKSLLPKIDIILISHAHRDHLDMKSIRYLMQRNPHLKIYSPQGSEDFFRSKKIISSVRIIKWYEKKTIGHLKIQFLPAQHWSQMKLNDYLQIHWGSYALSMGGNHLYFAGDTAYAGHFKEISTMYPQGFDYAFIPIGSYKPRSFMRTSHIAPEEALQATLDLGARKLLPIHWGAFQLGDDLPQEAIYHLRYYAQQLFQDKVDQHIHFWYPGKYIDVPLQKVEH